MNWPEVFETLNGFGIYEITIVQDPEIANCFYARVVLEGVAKDQRQRIKQEIHRALEKFETPTLRFSVWLTEGSRTAIESAAVFVVAGLGNDWDEIAQRQARDWLDKWQPKT